MEKIDELLIKAEKKFDLLGQVQKEDLTEIFLDDSYGKKEKKNNCEALFDQLLRFHFEKGLVIPNKYIACQEVLVEMFKEQMNELERAT